MAAAAYDPLPTGAVIDWQDCRVVMNGPVAAVRGTLPDVLMSWFRDFEVAGQMCRNHPRLGVCANGPLAAAEALVGLLPPTVGTITGHSLGGQIGVLLAGLLAADGRATRLVTWDSPKAGGAALAAVLSRAEIRQYKFRASIVTDWPLLLDRHVREPLIPILPWAVNPIEAHSIGRALRWLRDGVLRGD
jgi:hypothetical protein